MKKIARVFPLSKYAPIAQLVEHPPLKRLVGGSNPPGRTIKRAKLVLRPEHVLEAHA